MAWGTLRAWREQQRERVLRRRQDVRPRRVHHHHAPPGRLGHVDVVEADAGPAHDHEIGAGREHLGGHLSGAPDHERGHTGQRRAQLLGRETGLDLHVEAGGAHRVEPAFGKWFGDEDAGCHRK